MDGISECLCYYRVAQDPKQQTLANFDFNDIYVIWIVKYYFYFEAFQCTQWHISSKEWHGFVHVFVIGLGYHPSPQYLRVVKINQQLAHFIVCSEKCPSCSKCLWLNFEHKRMTLCCFLCITIWSLKIFLKGSITLNTLTGQNI